MPNKDRVVTPAVVRKLLHYDPETGVFTWRDRDPSEFPNYGSYRSWRARYCGVRAGSLWTDYRSGYQLRQIKIFRKNNREHRLAWMYMTGETVEHEIDHINRDATDNRWCNLKASTHAENCRNRSIRRDNRSGVTGVRWRERRKRWEVKLTLNGKTHHVGQFKEIDEAAMAALEFREENGMPINHGVGPARYYSQRA